MMSFIELADHAVPIIAARQVLPLVRAFLAYRLGRRGIAAVVPELVPAALDSAARFAAVVAREERRGVM